ncbi:hypothetical protein SAMN04487995_4795 [Dyadobacter koreensis]|uniref:Uncharacterized protein n=1 Tax=Dyadobacter koreensis TaxID=408657 RepID=A0A1H6Z9V3_9BACT|nr:hypothetical protein SAMN04487995_4795 [Dyadobacter koreensis]
MKQRQNFNLQLPIFSWLFFLFLSSGISYYHNNLQFGKPVQIERVDQLNSNSRRKVVAFSVITQKSNLYQKLNSQYLLIKLLSDRLENSVQIILNRQTCLFQKLLQTTILHFRSLSQASNSSDDFPGSIS